MSNEPTEITHQGAKIWLNSEGKWHSYNDHPAVIWPSGDYWWFRDGHSHRDNNLPAMVRLDGMCTWYINGNYIKSQYCTDEEIEEFKKPYYLQRESKIKFNRFEKLIK